MSVESLSVISSDSQTSKASDYILSLVDKDRRKHDHLMIQEEDDEEFSSSNENNQTSSTES